MFTSLSEISIYSKLENRSIRIAAFPRSVSVRCNSIIHFCIYILLDKIIRLVSEGSASNLLMALKFYMIRIGRQMFFYLWFQLIFRYFGLQLMEGYMWLIKPIGRLWIFVQPISFNIALSSTLPV